MLTIGIASYNNAERLDSAITNLCMNTTGDWKLFIVDNNSDALTKEVISKYVAADPRVIASFLDHNVGYVGAVNSIMKFAQSNGSHYVAYCDNDCDILTPGWNEKLEAVMEQHHDVVMAFPATYISYPIQRNGYTEILWGTGCMWMLNTSRIDEVGYFDEELGHQEEVDYQTRLRFAGWKIGATPEVQIRHYSTATTNPEAQERINQGVIKWVNKWNRIRVGPQVNYFSWNVTRFEDWMAAYLEEWYMQQPELKDLNKNPETVYIAALGREVDLCRVPRWQHLYRDRII